MVQYTVKINIAMLQTTESTGENLIFGKANWGNFMSECDKHLHQISNSMNTEMFDCKIMQGIISAAKSSIPKRHRQDKCEISTMLG